MSHLVSAQGINFKDIQAIATALTRMGIAFEQGDNLRMIDYYGHRSQLCDLAVRKHTLGLYADLGFKQQGDTVQVLFDSMNKNKVDSTLKELKQHYALSVAEQQIKKAGLYKTTSWSKNGGKLTATIKLKNTGW